MLDVRSHALPLPVRRTAVSVLRTQRALARAAWFPPTRELAGAELESALTATLVHLAAHDASESFLAALDEHHHLTDVWRRYYANLALRELALYVTHDAGIASTLLLAVAVAEALARA